MKKINNRDVPAKSWTSPKGKFAQASQDLSVALGRDPRSTDMLKRHPFDVELSTIPAGKTACPFHSHSAQWEYYHVVSGRGTVRETSGTTPVEAGDSFIFEPGVAHQISSDSSGDMVVMIIADNPIGDCCHYPDSNKWLVGAPTRSLIRSESLDYFDGEE
jgi:uncharacterized cupin superfamily protein